MQNIENINTNEVSYIVDDDKMNVGWDKKVRTKQSNRWSLGFFKRKTHIPLFIQCTDLTKQEGLVDTEGKTVNFVEGSPIKKLVDEFCKDKMEDRKVETMRSRVDNDTWKLCAELFLKETVDKSVVKANEVTKELSTYVTVWDEAFALLTVESNMKMWLTQVAGIPIDKEKGMELYVISGKAAKGKNTKIGWTLEGKKRYNDICRGVTAEREKEASKQKERWLLKQWAEEKDKNGRKRKRVEDIEAWEKEKKELEEFDPLGGF